MYKLYLEEHPFEDQLIAECKTVEDVFKEINKWIDRHNYHSHYIRRWVVGRDTYIDFGSWRQFFYYREVEDV